MLCSRVTVTFTVPRPSLTPTQNLTQSNDRQKSSPSSGGKAAGLLSCPLNVVPKCGALDINFLSALQRATAQFLYHFLGRCASLLITVWYLG